MLREPVNDDKLVSCDFKEREPMWFFWYAGKTDNIPFCMIVDDGFHGSEERVKMEVGLLSAAQNLSGG